MAELSYNTLQIEAGNQDQKSKRLQLLINTLATDSTSLAFSIIINNNKTSIQIADRGLYIKHKVGHMMNDLLRWAAGGNICAACLELHRIWSILVPIKGN